MPSFEISEVPVNAGVADADHNDQDYGTYGSWEIQGRVCDDLAYLDFITIYIKICCSISALGAFTEALVLVKEVGRKATGTIGDSSLTGGAGLSAGGEITLPLRYLDGPTLADIAVTGAGAVLAVDFAVHTSI